jgi:hypothetical protein
VHIEYMLASREWLGQDGALKSVDDSVVEGVFLVLRHATGGKSKHFSRTDLTAAQDSSKTVTVESFGFPGETSCRGARLDRANFASPRSGA